MQVVLRTSRSLHVHSQTLTPIPHITGLEWLQLIKQFLPARAPPKRNKPVFSDSPGAPAHYACCNTHARHCNRFTADNWHRCSLSRAPSGHKQYAKSIELVWQPDRISDALGGSISGYSYVSNALWENKKPPSPTKTQIFTTCLF